MILALDIYHELEHHIAFPCIVTSHLRIFTCAPCPAQYKIALFTL